MTPEERQMLDGLFERVKGAGSAQRDPQAESYINDAVRGTPYAPYVLAQTVLVQQHALENAANRIAELESAAQEAAESRQGQGGGGFLSSIFGGGPQARPDPGYRGPIPQQPPRGYAPPPPPPPQADPYQGQSQRGPWGAPPPAAGGGFLQNAMSTAAGVAGGVALGNLIGGLFSGGHGGGGLFGAGPAMAQPTETINNYYENGSDRNDGGFDPGVPDDAGFIDDSSFDDSSGGYDDA
jgi:hypothetical protein